MPDGDLVVEDLGEGAVEDDDDLVDGEHFALL